MVYIQSDKERKLPSHFDAACALYGALEQNQDIRLTSFEEVESGKFDTLIRSHLFVGSVDFMTEVFKRAGKIIGSMQPYQSSVSKLLLEAKSEIASGKKLFIKPVQNKLFTGMVFDLMTLSTLDKYPNDTRVLVSLPFESKIIAECRCYVRFNKIVDVRNYSGDFTVIPDIKWTENIVKNLIDFPSAYTIDVCLLENGQTEVVEFNDMWAIGNYGIDNSDYYKLLRERYFEIMRKN
jgi:hypothetical protein